MPIVLPELEKGTIETLIFDLTDRLGNITDLATHEVKYTVLDDADEIAGQYDDTLATVVLMEVQCLIDTTTLDNGVYELYIRFTNGQEVPFLRAGEFKVR